MNELIIFIVFLLLVAAWNGFVVLWGTAINSDTRRKANVYWHRIGWFIRAIPTAVLIWYYWGYFPDVVRVVAFALIFGHGFYNIIINIIRGMDWDYVGQTTTGTVSWWDMLIKSKIVFRVILALEIAFLVYAVGL